MSRNDKTNQKGRVSLAQLYFGTSVLTMLSFLVIVYFNDRLVSGFQEASVRNESSARILQNLTRVKEKADLLKFHAFDYIRQKKSKAYEEKLSLLSANLVELAELSRKHVRQRGITHTAFLEDGLRRTNEHIYTVTGAVRKQLRTARPTKRQTANYLKTLEQAVIELHQTIDQFEKDIRHLQIQSSSADREQGEFLRNIGFRIGALAVVLVVMLNFYGRRVITADKLMEQQRVQMVKSSRMSALGEMAGGIAHEINNPLGFIQGYLEQVERVLKKEPLDRSKLDKSIASMKFAVERITKIINGLRTFSRDGESDPFNDIPIKKVVDEALLLCQEKIKRKQVEIHTTIEPEDMKVACQEVQLGQVVLNLISNSADAVSENSEKWVRVEAKHVGESLVLSVTDSGKGIPKHLREKILEPFFTTKAVGVGTGMGLSISKGIVEAHNGTLTIDESCPNTRFVIKIPLNQEKSKPILKRAA